MNCYLIYLLLLFTLLTGQICAREERRLLETKKEQYCSNYLTLEKDKDGEMVEVIVSASKREEAKTLRERISILRDDSEQIELIAKGGEYENYIKSLIRVGIPYAIFAGLSLLGLFSYAYCSLCESACPPCKSCRRDIVANPYSEKEFKVPAYTIIIFCILAVGAGVYGFTISQQITKITGQLRCAIISVLDELSEGTTIDDKVWLGLSNVEEPLLKIIQNLQNVRTQAQTTFSSQDWIESDMDDIKRNDEQLYIYYHDTVAKVPYTYNQEIAANTPVSSEYLDNKFGPSDVSNTSLFNLQQALLNSTYVIGNVFLELKNSAQDLDANFQLYKTQLNEARKLTNHMSRQIEMVQDKFLNYLETPEKYNDMTNYIFAFYFGGSVLGCIFSILGVILAYCQGPNPQCRVFIHIGWILMTLFMIAGFTMSSILMPLSVAASETCTWMDRFISTETEFTNPEYTMIPEDLSQKIAKCKWGDGDLREDFQMEQSLSSIQILVDNSLRGPGIFNSSSEYYMDTGLFDDALVNEIDYIAQVMQGLVTDNSEADQFMLELKYWTDHSLSGSKQTCSYSRDTWYWSEAFCGSLPKYNEASNDPLYLLGSQLCLSIEKFSDYQTSSRYWNIDNSGCTSTQYEITIRQQALSRYFEARKGLLQSIQDDFSSYSQLNNDYLAKLSAFSTQVHTFSDNIQSFRTIVRDDFLNKFNCKFLGPNVERVYDSICIGFITPIFKMIISIAVTSGGMFFASLFSNIIAIRYARNARKNLKIHDDSSQPSRQMHKNSSQLSVTSQSRKKLPPLTKKPKQ